MAPPSLLPTAWATSLQKDNFKAVMTNIYDQDQN